MISFEAYSLEILKKAQKLLDAISEPEHSKIIIKIEELATKKSKSLNIKKLQGYSDLYRLSVNNHRVIFMVIQNKKSLLVVLIGHRREIYNQLERSNIF